MANQYKNKVVYNGTTLIDISDTTAVQSDVASGKSFYTASGQKVLGTSSGGGSSVQTVTGTVSGSGTNTLQIPCDFAPDLIYVHGDMTGDASLRGCTLFIIIKDTYLQANIDSSSSNTEEYIFWNDYSITGYSGNDVSMPHGEYASGNVIFYTVNSSSSARFNSAVTYTYKFIKWT